MKVKDCVLVFECYHGGKHSKRMALSAKKWFGALSGYSDGRWGRSYAIPTHTTSYSKMSIDSIKVYVAEFIRHATNNPEDTFLVTRIGHECYTFRDNDIAPLFKDCPLNCILPVIWQIPTHPYHTIYQINKKDLETEINVQL